MEIINTKVVRFMLCAWFLALSLPAYAQQQQKVPRIGFISTASLSALASRLHAFRQGLRDLGYVEGRNLAIEYRSAEGNIDRLPELAAELVRIKIDCIVTAGAAPTRAAKQATGAIPIIMANNADPVNEGLVASLARPGGNITGLTNTASDLAGKRLELLKEAIPKLSRVTFFSDVRRLSSSDLEGTEAGALLLKLRINSVAVKSFEELENRFRSIVKARADAFIADRGGFFVTHQKELVELAVKYRLPGMYPEQEFVLAGGLMTYATSISDLYRRAAFYVDKILKGTKPGDLPVEQPTKFELIINLKAAKQIGLTIPPNVLARADKVIK
jgi:putative tryptophan/tyrosine transport system substrate-binding protein